MLPWRPLYTADCLDVVPTVDIKDIGSDSSVITKNIRLDNLAFTACDLATGRSLVKRCLAAVIQYFAKVEPPQQLKGFGGRDEYLFNAKIIPIVKIYDKIFNAEFYIVADSFLSHPMMIGGDLL